jgi:cobalt/nickel transport system permease protein
MSAAFFVASLIHVPLGPASLHLVLGGLVGLLLGWAAFPAILVALALQALLFSFGGLVVLGANTLIMALPALLCHWLFSPLVRSSHRVAALSGAALAGAGYVLLAGFLSALALYFSGEAFITAAQAILLAHLPLAVLEGLITALAVGFIRRVRPAMLYAERSSS